MADIIDKIGKYFAEQEAQMRSVYVHAAAAAAEASARERSAPKAAPQPPKRDEKYGSRPARSRQNEGNDERPFVSLVAKGLSLAGEKTQAGTTVIVAKSGARGSSDGAEVEEELAWVTSLLSDCGLATKRNVEKEHSEGKLSQAASDCGSESLSDATASTSKNGSKTPKKPKKKSRKKSKQPREGTHAQAAAVAEKERQRAAEGFARAQERARRILVERVHQEKQQQQEREANAARLQEEMRKIEEIRRRGKQFAVRLPRPQSAPSPSQSRTPLQQQQQRKQEASQGSARWAREKTEEEGERRTEEQEEGVCREKRGFLDGLERGMHDQMMREMEETQRLYTQNADEQQEWARLEAQIKRTTDRNAIRQERVVALAKSKQALEQEISRNQTYAVEMRQERHQLEEKSKRERQQKQREAERQIHARLRKEETQRLVDEERTQSDCAAEARAKAKLRVQSRAALLKRVLHGCDIRADTSTSRKSQNQEEAEGEVKGKASKMTECDELGPELAEFEEDGLGGESLPSQPPVPSPTRKTATRGFLQLASDAEPASSTSHFEWRVPRLASKELHVILRDELAPFTCNDVDDQNAQPETY